MDENKKNHKIRNRILLGLGIVLIIFLAWQGLKKPPTVGDWQTQLAVPSVAQFAGDLVTIKNVRDFRYGPTEQDMRPGYYDKTYDLTKLSKVWYVTEPFKGQEFAAHTFLSFEFEPGNAVSITIEARKTKQQDFNFYAGMLRNYPLIYIAADERDVILLRTQIRKDDVYMYPVYVNQINARKLFVDMLQRMNDLPVRGAWYNTFVANCTSSIRYEINRVFPGRLPLTWKVWASGYADEFALEQGLLDTDLPLAAARQKYRITEISNQIGDVPNYSGLLRQALLK